MSANDPLPVSMYGVFHRGDRRSLLRVATIDPILRDPADWPDALGLLSAAGVTTVRVRIPWARHARVPGPACLDGSDGRTPDVKGVLRHVVVAGLDVWVDAGPIAGGVPTWVAETCPGASAVDARGRRTGRWALSDPGFRSAATTWVTQVAAESMSATDGRVAIWEVDGVADALSFPADHSLVTVSRFRSWLRDRYGEDRALGREWLRPGLRIDEATPPIIAVPRGGAIARLLGHTIGAGRRVASWLLRRLAGDNGSVAGDPWPELVNGTTHAPWGIGLRNSPRQALTVEKEGRSPGQLADWHAFTIDVWNEHRRAMHLAVNGVLPTATIVVREVGQSGVAGIGVGATDVRENVGHAPFPLVQVGPSVHDAAWGAASLVARAKAERPVMVAIPCDRGDTTRGAAVLAAIAEGAIAIELPATAFADPDVRRIAGWLGEVEADLTASTRLDDRLTWIDDPTHAGADLDDLDGIARRGEMDRSDVAGAYAAVREAGLAPVIVDVEAFAPDDAQDLGALLVPTRRWTDLERYGSLVVHVLRGGNLVAFPHAPRRQRDGTAFRSTFLWPASVSGGGRVQVHDGTSTLVSTPASEPTVGDRAEWIEDVIDAVSPRFRIARGMRLAVTARLLPDGACLAFVMNPTNRRQVGAVTVPDAGALGLADTYDVVVAIATCGASVRREGMGFLVDVPPGGAVVARLSDSARAPMPR